MCVSNNMFMCMCVLLLLQRWHLAAASPPGKHPPSQNALGVIFREGSPPGSGGVQRSYPEALKWFLKAAEQGYAQSQHNVGSLYEQGLLGGRVKMEEARKWYQLAANQGFTEASIALKRTASHKPPPPPLKRNSSSIRSVRRSSSSNSNRNSTSNISGSTTGSSRGSPLDSDRRSTNRMISL